MPHSLSQQNAPPKQFYTNISLWQQRAETLINIMEWGLALNLHTMTEAVYYYSVNKKNF